MAALFCSHFCPVINILNNTDKWIFFAIQEPAFMSNNIHQDAKFNSQQFFY